MSRFWQILKGAESASLPAKTPDITKAQVAGWLQFAGSVAVASGMPQDEAMVLIGASGIVAFGIHLGDAIIRKGRAGALAVITSQGAGRGRMGVNAPEGDEIPPSPTLAGDGTGTEPPGDMKAALDTTDVTGPTGQPTAPPVAPPAAPPPPTPAELLLAKETADAAAKRFADLQARSQQQ